MFLSNRLKTLCFNYFVGYSENSLCKNDKMCNIIYCGSVSNYEAYPESCGCCKVKISKFSRKGTEPYYCNTVLTCKLTMAQGNECNINVNIAAQM